MTFANYLVWPEYPVPTQDPTDERNAPSLIFHACCDSCGRGCQLKASSEGAAAALALAQGWYYQLNARFKLDGVFTADHLTGAAGKLWCPRCAFEERLDEQ